MHTNTEVEVAKPKTTYISKTNITLEPDQFGAPYERCCFCRKETPWWVGEKDVACCKPCADKHQLRDVPSKEKWFEQERAIDDLKNIPTGVAN